ncbi:MAG TPA: cation diffusion facilitator family transporter [Gaiellaceae bacterium]|nr:cation diffusion facilitator family transporter [Gaiellaceae bacterium]
MSPQRKTALLSVLAAGALIALKLGTGLATGSLGLISEAVHSGTDLIAALLTFFAVGVAVRPADPGHQYGHGKAEHLAALAEATFLALASLAIAWRAATRLGGGSQTAVHARWYAIVVIGVVILVDLGRTTASSRAARRYGSAALSSNALHFASDLAGSVAVLVGLLLARAGHPKADAIAALFVAVLVLAAAARLMRRNVDVLMDRAPADAEDAARAAIEGLEPAVELRRLRMRQAAGRHFADVVIGVSVDDAVGQGHAAADAVERAVQTALPEADVVVHVEPEEAGGAVRERAHAAALGVPRVREVHNVSAVSVGAGTELSLHLKLPAELSLEEAHAIAEEVERAIRRAAPEVTSVQTHLEPLAGEAEGSRAYAADVVGERECVERIVREETGSAPRELRFLRTDEGLVAYLTLAVAGSLPLADAHAEASRIEERVRRERPEIADVIVHTEP